MKKIRVTLFVVCLFCQSCHKNSNTFATSSLNIVHAVLNTNDFAVNFVNPPIPYYKNKTFISFASYAEYGLLAGFNPISIVSSSDTTNVFFSAEFNLKQGGIYSLYLSGQTKAIDTLFIQDQIPYYPDSSSGVRFINLSPGSQPISVNLAGNPGPQTEFANIGYKEITAFKTYSALSSVGGTYTFEIRDQASDSLLTTYSWNYSLQKNNTIVISGTESNGLTLFSVNNY